MPGLKAIADTAMLRRVVVYTLSGSLSALIAFGLLPVLTRYLTPRDYGIVETFTVLTTCLSGVVLLGGNTLLAKEYFDHGHAERKLLAGRVLALTVLCSVLLLAIVASIDIPTGWISRLIKLGDLLIYLAIVVSLFNAVVALATTLLQVEKRAWGYALFVNSKTVVEIAVSLSLILFFGFKWQGRIAGISAASLVYGLVGLLLLKPSTGKSSLAFEPTKRLLVLGLPLAAAHVSVWIYGMVDRVMINNLFDLTNTGLYSVGFRFGTVVSMVETAVSLAWMPYFYENIRRREVESDRQIVKLSYWYAGGLLLFAVGFGLVARWLLPIMVDARFYAARRYIMPICVAFWFSGVWKIFGLYLIAEEKTRTYSIITCGTAAAHIALAYILLRTVGVVGAAWATMLSFAVATVATIVVAVKLRPMPWGHPFLRRSPEFESK